MLSAFLSHQPVAPTVQGYDNSGTNVSTSGYSPLLALVGSGNKYSDYLSKSDLETLVADYNSRIAGTLTPAGKAGVTAGQTYPKITLPSDYQLGDSFSSQDMRLGKTFGIGHANLQVFGEVFNIFNDVEPHQLQLQPARAGHVREGQPAGGPDLRLRRSARVPDCGPDHLLVVTGAGSVGRGARRAGSRRLCRTS